MLPVAHAVVGVAALWVVRRATRRESPTPGETAAVLVATQLPDLIDKPLAWTLGVLPTGRTLGHSLVTASLLLALVLVVAGRLDRPSLALAVGVGYVSAILTDLPPSVLAGDFSRGTFLLWPILPSPEYTEPALVTSGGWIELTPAVLFQVVAGICLVGLLLVEWHWSTS